MAGTVGDKCVIQNCKTRSGNGNYTAIDYGHNDVTITDDAYQWGIERVSADKIQIWDKVPR